MYINSKVHTQSKLWIIFSIKRPNNRHTHQHKYTYRVAALSKQSLKSNTKTNLLM